MSFFRNMEFNGKLSDREHLPANVTTEIHQHINHWKASQMLVLPPINKFGGQIRSKPQSGFNQASLISGQGQLDFHLNSAGYAEKLSLEMEITVANNPVTVIPAYLIDRLELLSTEGNVLQTIYGDCIYLVKINKTLEQHNREKFIENLDASYNGVAVPVGPKRFIFHLPTFVDGVMPKLSVIKSKLIVRVYFSNLGVTSGLASDITVSLCDIIQSTQQLSGQLESLENTRKAMSKLWYRFLNPVRVTSQVLQMVASNQYDIRLTSANNLSAYVVFVIRAAPLTGANINTFIKIDNFELLDNDTTVQGIKINDDFHKVLSQSFVGDIFNYKNIYVLPFTISVDASNQGSQCGFYSFSSNEILRIYTTSTLVTGSYRIDVYTFDYNKLIIDKGILDVSK